MGSDFFDKTDTLRKLWPKLIKSCSIDALEQPAQEEKSTSPEEVSHWLESSASATQEPFPSPGLGSDIRIEGQDVLGASLVIDDHRFTWNCFAAPYHGKRIESINNQTSDDPIDGSDCKPHRPYLKAAAALQFTFKGKASPRRP